MLKLHKRLPKVLLSAVLVLLAILASPASASGRKPPKDERPVWMGTTHLPVSHAGTTFSTMPKTAEVAAMTAFAQQQPNGSTFPYGWYESGRQPFLDSLMPGVRYVSTFESEPFDRRAWHHFALVDGELQPMQLLNVFLQDAGFKFDSAHMAEAAQAAVLLTHFGVQLDTAMERRQPGCYRFVDRTGPYDSKTWADGRAGTLAFPPIEFLSMKMGLWKETPHYRHPGLWISCRVEGVRESLFVGFARDVRTGYVYADVVRGWISSYWLFSPPDLDCDFHKQSPADTTEPRKTGGAPEH